MAYLMNHSQLKAAVVCKQEYQRRKLMMERPHSRKKTVEEGTAQVRKGEQIQDSVQAGEGLAFSKEKAGQKEEKKE